MKIDAHYYGTLAFARACGCTRDCAHKIAYASQFVDDAKVNHFVIEGQADDLEEVQNIDGKPSFFNAATCHSYDKVNTFNFSAMINNTSAFHFVPGCEGQSFVRKLRCGEKSPIIESILAEAVEEGDPVRLGLVLHAYADTFAHQGFSGLLSKVNDIRDTGTDSFTLQIKFIRIFVNILKWFNHRKFDEIVNKIIPAYGHGQAWDYPDIPSLKWHYNYDYSDEFSQSYKRLDIDNPARYRRAFENIKKNLELFLERHPSHRDDNVKFNDFEKLYVAILKKAYGKNRIRRLRNLLVEYKLFAKSDKSVLNYDGGQWLKEAFRNFDKKTFSRRKVEPAVLHDDFIRSDWYAYYRGVKWYKQRFHHYCKQNGINIPH